MATCRFLLVESMPQNIGKFFVNPSGQALARLRKTGSSIMTRETDRAGV